MGPTWVLSAPDGPHVGPMNLVIRGLMFSIRTVVPVSSKCMDTIGKSSVVDLFELWTYSSGECHAAFLRTSNTLHAVFPIRMFLIICGQQTLLVIAAYIIHLLTISLVSSKDCLCQIYGESFPICMTYGNPQRSHDFKPFAPTHLWDLAGDFGGYPMINKLKWMIF